ncbi:MAG TPA: TonB family protein [Terriglobales bacterium]|nr:TonB family protein [Terriglobales bacterium]
MQKPMITDKFVAALIIETLWPGVNFVKPGYDFSQSAAQERLPAFDPPAFLVWREPWYRTFTGNLIELVRRPGNATAPSSSAPFWNDVFVSANIPWVRFAESLIFHAAAVAVLWSSAQIWPQRPRLSQPTPFDKSAVISYAASEYLAPLDTGGSSAPVPQKGDPVYAPQDIISVPAESDNQQQTIVTPPALKLSQDVALPNVVNWSRPAPTIPVVPIVAQTSNLRLPVMAQAVVAPAPEVSRTDVKQAPILTASVVAPAPEVRGERTGYAGDVPQAAVVQPPPGIELASLRKVGDMNIGHAEVIAPAPELPVDEQHAAVFSRQSLGSSPSVVPPPPSVQPGDASRTDARLIALSMNPTPPPASVEVPNGNRRGTFAATLQGKPGSSGAPEISANTMKTGIATTLDRSSKNLNGVPSGLLVGAEPKLQATAPVSGTQSTLDRNAAGDPSLVAKAMPPRTLAVEMSAAQETESDKKIFGARKSYAMAINLPNLNSAGGSLVMHFSELRDEQKQGDLLAPVITRAAAPGYPLELMRENVQGTVELSAVIHSDGSVRDITMLNDVDERLQALAREALLRWQFLPALRNGSPVPLQAVVKIPFKARAIRF